METDTCQDACPGGGVKKDWAYGGSGDAPLLVRESAISQPIISQNEMVGLILERPRCPRTDWCISHPPIKDNGMANNRLHRLHFSSSPGQTIRVIN